MIVNSLPTTQKAHFRLITKRNGLMLFSKIIVTYSENHTVSARNIFVFYATVRKSFTGYYRTQMSSVISGRRPCKLCTCYRDDTHKEVTNVNIWLRITEQLQLIADLPYYNPVIQTKRYCAISKHQLRK